MRFVAVDGEVSLSALEATLKETDAAYQIERDEDADSEGVLTHTGEVYGQVEINRPGDEIFDGEIEELKAAVEGSEGVNKAGR
jgi:hypothetical protein